MTTTAYPKAAAARKPMTAFQSSRENIGIFEVHANGDVFPQSDIVIASLTCHELRGKLYRVHVAANTPNGFRRQLITPLALDIARDCANRVPRKNEPVLMCVPVWR